MTRSFQTILGTLLWAFLIPHARAAVAYVDIDPDQIVTMPGAGPGLISQYDIDFNGDGSREVRIYVSASATVGFNALPVLGTRILSIPDGPFGFYAFPALPGQSVGAIALGPSVWAFDSSPGSALGACVGFGDLTSCVGYFVEGFVGYVAVEFTLPDGIHYGTIEIEGLYGNGRIRSYAWETTPGVSIIAGSVPEPERIGLLIAGSLGLIATRRRRSFS